MRKILLVALTAAAMVSCSENEGFENESTMNRIKFGTVVKTGTRHWLPLLRISVSLL